MIILIENLRMCSNEQLELKMIAKKLGYVVKEFETLRTSLKIIEPEKFINLNEKYVIFCSVHTLKALKNIDDKYTEKEKELLNHMNTFIYYNESFFNGLNFPFMFNQFEKKEITLFSKFKENKFVKSISGLKEIPSGVVCKGESFWDYLKARQKNSPIIKNYHKNKTLNIEILISKPQSLQNTREYRYFISNNEIIGKSLYLIDDELECNNETPLFVDEFVKNIIKEYQPYFHYVIDIITLENNECYVLEYNCINSSGMYDINKEKMLLKLIEYTNNDSGLYNKIFNSKPIDIDFKLIDPIYLILPPLNEKTKEENFEENKNLFKKIRGLNLKVCFDRFEKKEEK